MLRKNIYVISYIRRLKHERIARFVIIYLWIMLLNIVAYYFNMARHFKILHGFFRFFCTSTTIVLTGICFHKFMKNDDLAQINFPTYHQKEHAIYPTLTLCFMGPNIFVEDKLYAYKKGYNSTSYASFLSGEYWMKDMMDIDFDNVTLDIEEYLEAISITSSENQTIYKHCSSNFQLILQELMGYKCLEKSNATKPFLISFKNHQTKCFSISIPFDQYNKVQNLRLFLKSSIFPQQLHEDFKFDKNFGVFVHYPQQFFRSPIHKLYQKVQNDSNLSVLNFKLFNMEVLRRRKNCNDKWNDDDKILEKTINVVGCKPPHWDTSSKESKCTRPNQIRSYNLPFVEWIPNVPSMKFLDDLPPPCQDILEIHYEYSETNWDKAEFAGLDVETDFFEVNLAFPSPTYKEIIHVRAYDEESLMGYVGGYIGMFLGLGLLQVPELLQAALKTLRETKQRKARNRLNERRNGENGTHLVAHCRNNHIKNDIKKANANNQPKTRDIWSTDNEIQRQSLVNRIDNLEAKVEQVLLENRALKQRISKQECVEKKRLQEEILL